MSNDARYTSSNPVAQLIRAAAGTTATPAFLFIVVLLLVLIRLFLFLFLLFLFLDGLLPDLRPALVQRFLCEKSVRRIGIEFTFFDEDLIDFLAVALARHLKRLRHTADRMIIGIIFDGFAAHARARIASDYDFSQRQMRGLRKSNANRAIVAVHDLDPVRFLQVHHVGSEITQNRSLFLPAIAQHIIDVDFQFFLKVGNGNLIRITDAAAIQHPSFVAALYLNNVSFRQVFAAVFVGEFFVVDKFFVTHQFAAVAERAFAPFASSVAHGQIIAAAQSFDGFLNKFLRLRGALLRHHDFGLLLRTRGRSGEQAEACESDYSQG